MSDKAAGGHDDLFQRQAADDGAAIGRADTPASQPPEQPARPGPIRPTRISLAWVALTTAAVLLVALVIFIVQNAREVSIHYLGLDGRVSLAVALLIAAVAGMLLVAAPGTARIMQLRRAVKKSTPTRPGGH